MSDFFGVSSGSFGREGGVSFLETSYRELVWPVDHSMRLPALHVRCLVGSSGISGGVIDILKLPRAATGRGPHAFSASSDGLVQTPSVWRMFHK
jgi:hypothetical protein